MAAEVVPSEGTNPALLVLPPELTHQQAAACLELLLQSAGQQADARQPLCVDAGLLQRFDSSALAVLLALRRAGQRQGRGFQVQHLPERLRTLAGLYGIGALLDDPDAAQAAGSASGP